LYFVAVGLALEEMGVSLTAYLASASIIGLAVGFGSQGLVQDVVTGLTIILNDLFDVEDLVEMGGQVGVVQQVGIRFTVIVNPLGARVFIPNRSIASVVVYARGWLRCIVDVRLPFDAEQAKQAEEVIREISQAASLQFPGAMRAATEIMGVLNTASNRRHLRVKFRIWPGRGAPIETNLRQEIIQAVRTIDSTYADWMVAVTYESEESILLDA